MLDILETSILFKNTAEFIDMTISFEYKTCIFAVDDLYLKK